MLAGITLLGAGLVCLTALALDASLFGMAVTVVRTPQTFDDDPFVRLFGGTAGRTDLFAEVAPPCRP